LIHVGGIDSDHRNVGEKLFRNAHGKVTVLAAFFPRRHRTHGFLGVVDHPAILRVRLLGFLALRGICLVENLVPGSVCSSLTLIHRTIRGLSRNRFNPSFTDSSACRGIPRHVGRGVYEVPAFGIPGSGYTPLLVIERHVAARFLLWPLGRPGVVLNCFRERDALGCLCIDKLLLRSIRLVLLC